MKFLYIKLFVALSALSLHAGEQTLSSISTVAEDGSHIIRLVSYPDNHHIMIGENRILFKATAFKVIRDEEIVWRKVIPTPENVTLGNDPYLGLLAESTGGGIFVILAARNTGWIGIAEIPITSDSVQSAESNGVTRLNPDTLVPSQPQESDGFVSPDSAILGRMPQIQKLSLADTDDSGIINLKVNSCSSDILSYDSRKKEWVLISKQKIGSQIE